MRRAVFFLLFSATIAIVAPRVVSSAAPLAEAEKSERRELLRRQAKAVEHLIEADAKREAGDAAAFSAALKSALLEIDHLVRASAVVPAPQRDALSRLARELLRVSGAPNAFVLATLRAPLDDVGKTLRPKGRLELLGSYTQPVVEEQAVGGHASAMGPPPMQVTSQEDTKEVAAVQLVERAGILTQKTYWGSKTKDHILESGGGAVALFDYDGDGRVDIFTGSGFERGDKRRRIPHRSALYRNLGGWKFSNVTEAAGLAAPSDVQGVCVGDMNNDAWPDLYVTNFGPNLLYKNNGDGTFTEAAASAGLSAGGWSTGCAFFDADGDGHLDLYLARYMTVSEDEVTKAERTMKWRGGPMVMAGPVGLPGAADLFFRNRGDGTFVEATEAAGLVDAAKAYGFGVAATDYDGDGWTDIFVANDSMPNFLYRNDGKGRFESVGLLAGVAVNSEARAQAGMGVDAGDYDGDGQMDLLLTTFAHDTKTVYRNVGGGQFEDASQSAGLAARTFMRMGWGAQFVDLDLDGRLDIFFANGHLYPQVDDFPDLGDTYRQRNQLLLNDGGTFKDVSDQAGEGLTPARTARGLATADLDDDGDRDLVLTNMDDTPTLLESRVTAGRHWVGFSLAKAGTNRLCIGAQVVLTAGGRTQRREVRSGGSYLSQSELRVAFGLGAHKDTVDVEVRLPGQGRWVWKGLPIDRYQTLTLDDAHRLRAPLGKN